MLLKMKISKLIYISWLTVLLFSCNQKKSRTLLQSDIEYIYSEVLKKCLDEPFFDYAQLYIKDFDYIISVSKDLEKPIENKPTIYEGINFDSLKKEAQYQSVFDTVHIKSWKGKKIYHSSRSDIMEGSFFWRKFSDRYLNGDVRVNISSFMFSKPYIYYIQNRCFIMFELYLKWDSSLNKACILVESDYDYKIKKISFYKAKFSKSTPPPYPGSHDIFK